MTTPGISLYDTPFHNGPPMPPQAPYRLNSLRKGLDVLACFTRRDTWTLAELAVALDLSKPTIFRILHTLEGAGFLSKMQGARYAAGLRLHAASPKGERLSWQSLPHLQDLAQSTGESVHIGILHGAEAICVQAVEGTRLVRMRAFVGKRTPAHASALGKILLAHLPAPELDALLAGRPLTAFTRRTLTDPGALRAALKRIRTQGWALDEEEMEPGLRCLGVPLADHTGRAIAAIALSAPASRMNRERVASLIPQLQDTAARIARTLGGAIRDAA